MKKADIQGLKDIDRKIKPGNAQDDWERAWRMYHDCSRVDTQARLKSMGVGIADNPSPLEVQLLRRVVDRLAVIYSRPPTRWFVRNGKRLSDTSDEHVQIVETLERSKYDLAMRHVDKTRANLRQAIVRFYPSDTLGCVVPRVFEPHIVIREPSTTCPDVMDEDSRFALKLRGGASPGDELWEYWERNGPVWKMAMVDGAGELSGPQPFESTGLVSPYEKLPVQIMFDGYPAGAAWLPPRSSRVSWADAINAMANDLWALIHHEAHTQIVISTDDAKLVPKEHGPGVTWVLPKDAVAEVLSGTVHMKEAQEVLDAFVRLWSLSEDLPISEFDRAKQMVTGAALKVASQPLLTRRADQVMLACADERAAFERYRAVHNEHAAASEAELWAERELIADDLELDVEIAEMDIPTDKAEIQDVGAKQIMLGTGSLIDLIEAENGIPRHEAIERYEQIQKDLTDYPPRADPGAGPGSTTGADGLPTPRSTTEEVYQTNSMAQGAAEAGAGASNDLATTIPAGSADPMAASAPPAAAVPAQNSALNGAQVTAALDIVGRVAAGELPRDTGVAMLIAFFNLSPDTADGIMGSVGNGFKAPKPEPPPAPAFGAKPPGARGAAPDSTP